MNALISFLEFLDGKTLPALLLLLLLLTALFFAYRAYKSRSNRKVPSMNDDVIGSSGAHSRVIGKYVENPDYNSILRGSAPLEQGRRAGWFTPEQELCDFFLEKKQKLLDRQVSELANYPTAQIEYLKIVDEAGRKPMPSWIWGLLLLLLFAEAFGFSLIVSDLINDVASMMVTEIQGYLIAGVVAFIGLWAAHLVGHKYYRQVHARTAWLISRKGGFGRTESQETNNRSGNNKSITTIDIDDGKHSPTAGHTSLGIEDNNQDADRPQSERIANRSSYVAGCAKKMTLKDGDTEVPRFHWSFWAYLVGVIIVGIGIAMLRFNAIESSVSAATQDSQSVAAAAEEFGTESSSTGPTRPPAIDQSRQESLDIVTQEKREADAHAKRTAAIMFVIIFFLVQIMALGLSASFGFVVDHSKEAYKKIFEFKKIHGDISLGQYKENLGYAIKNADREAQATLHKWQIGLQTAYANFPNKVNISGGYFEECVANSPARTYAIYCAAFPPTKEDTQPESDLSEQSPHRVGEANLGLRTGVSLDPAEQANADSLRPDLRETQFPINESVEYCLQSSNGKSPIVRCSLVELKAQVAEAELESTTLMVRREAEADGRPGSWKQYAEFVKNAKLQT